MLEIQYRKVEDLIPYARNSRTHSDAQVAQIAASIKEFGWTNPVLIDGENGIIAGHGRLMAARKLGQDEVPTIELAGLSDAQKRAYIIADNKLALNAGWDEELLALELGELQELGFDIELTGFTADELAALEDEEEGGEAGEGGSLNLADRFMIPPFSVLNAREGWWQTRKRAWIRKGIKSEEGRGEDVLKFSDACKEGYSKASRQTLGAMPNADKSTAQLSGTSIFDPVMCEIAYRWFCPPGGLILDCFAGGSVRGIVASMLGRQYVGHELRGEQVAANRAQGDELCAHEEFPPVWVEGDSRNIGKTCHDVKADFVFSCPPYADLEVYSDDPADLSTLDYKDFRAAYFEIIAETCKLLKNDRFACFVIGEVRDKKGNYYDFVGDTVEAFRAAGLHYYNEAILVTAVGSLPIRAGKQFSASRKLGKTHQNVLVFVKGDAKKAVAACGPVEVDESMFDEMEAQAAESQ